MKFTAVILFSLLVGTLGYTWEPEELECANEQNVDKAMIEKINNPLTAPTPIDNKVLNDLLECTWRKQGVFNSDDTLNWDAIDKVIEYYVTQAIKDLTSSSEDISKFSISVEEIHGAVSKCRAVDVSGSTPGQSCAKAQNCIGEQLRHWLNSSEEKTNE